MTYIWQKAIFKHALENEANNNTKVIYTYDTNKNRITKQFNGIITSYTYENGKLISENGANGIITFLYDSFEETEYCAGFNISDNDYFYIPDENGSVIYVTDSQMNTLAMYDYTNDLTGTTYEKVNDSWVVNNDPDFIGNINPLKYQKWYYDKEANLYYVGSGMFYDALNNSYIQNDYKMNTDLLNTRYLKGETRDLNYNVITKYNNMMSDPNFGININKVPTESEWNSGIRWYDGLSAIDVVSRCLYGENTANATDRLGVAIVIINRSISKSITPYVATTQKSQFSTINPGSYAKSIGLDTNYARHVPAKTDSNYTHAILVSCLIDEVKTDKTEFNKMFVIPDGISNQINFYGVNNMKGNNSYTVTGGKIYENGSPMKDVAFAGFGLLKIPSGYDRETLLSPYYLSNSGKWYNLFYNK